MNISKISCDCCPKPKVNFGAFITNPAQKEINQYLAAHPEERDTFDQINTRDDISIDLDKYMLGGVNYLTVKKLPDTGYRLLTPLTSMERLQKAIENIKKPEF